MERNKQEELDPKREGEKMNTSSGQNKHEEQNEKKGGIHNNALYAASMGRPATAQVDPHSNAGLAQTGTNNSYEGPLGAGSGGAAGTGYTSGQPATGARIATDSDYDKASVGKEKSKDGAEEDKTQKED